MKLNTDYIVKFKTGTAKVRLIYIEERNGYAILNRKTVYRASGHTKVYAGAKTFLAGQDVHAATIDAKRWIAWNFGDDYTLKEYK